MNYQLVLQFPEARYGDIDWIVEMEDKLAEKLSEAEIDGHDIGSGEVNIFIFTNNPVATFDGAKETLKAEGVLNYTKAAYRNIDDAHFFCLWPEGLIGICCEITVWACLVTKT